MQNKMAAQPLSPTLKSNNTTNNAKKNKNTKQKDTKNQIKNENSKSFQNIRNPKKNQQRSKSPRKKKPTVPIVEGVKKDNRSMDKVVAAPKQTLTVSKSAVDGRSSLVSTTATICDTSNSKSDSNVMKADSKKSFDNKTAESTGKKSAVTNTSNSSNNPTASYQSKKGKNSHYRKRKSSRKGVGMNNQKDSDTTTTIANSSNDLNRQTSQNQQSGQSQQHQHQKNQCDAINDVSKEGHNQDEKKQCENKENINNMKQDHKRNSKNFKGTNRKWYYNHQRKVNNNHLVQQRDVNNYKPTLEEGRRTATSPMNVNVYETTGMKPIVSPEDSPIKEKTDDNYTSPKYDNDVGKHSNGNSGSRKKQNQRPKSSSSNKTSSKVIDNSPNEEGSVMTNETSEIRSKDCDGDSKATVSIVIDDDVTGREKHLGKSKPESEEKCNNNNPRLASSSSAGNVVTSNAAGKALLKRLSVSNLPSPTGYTASTTGTTYDVNIDYDACTELSGDMSRIDLNIEQGQEFDANMIYPNTIMFQPQHHLQMPHFEAMGAAYNHEVPPPHLNQQWMMPSQSEIPSQEDYSNMIAFNAQNQQVPIATNPMLTHVRHENAMYQPLPVAVPPFYDQSYQMLPQVPMAPMYQQHQSMPVHIAPLPLKYEQLTIGGCVFFNPVYDLSGGDGSDSACSVGTKPVDKETSRVPDLTAEVTEVDSKNGGKPSQQKKLNDQKSNGKSGRKKKKYHKKKTVTKGN